MHVTASRSATAPVHRMSPSMPLSARRRRGRRDAVLRPHAEPAAASDWREARSLTLPYSDYAACPHFAADDRAVVAVTGSRRVLRFDLRRAPPEEEDLAGGDDWMIAAKILWRDERHRRAAVVGELGDVILMNPLAPPGLALEQIHAVSPGMCIGGDIDVGSQRILTATWDEMIYVRPLVGEGAGADIRPVGGRGFIYEVFLRLGGSCVVYHRFGTGVYAVDPDGERCLAPGELWASVQPVVCDPRLLLVQPAAGGVMLWDLCTRAPVTTPRLPKVSDVATARLSPRADFLVTAASRVATLWRLHEADAPDRWRLRRGRGALTDVVFSASGGKLALLYKESGAYFWSTQSWPPTYLGACITPQEPWSIDFSVAEDHAVVAGWEKTLTVKRLRPRRAEQRR